MYDVVVKNFTFAVSSRDELVVLLAVRSFQSQLRYVN